MNESFTVGNCEFHSGCGLEKKSSKIFFFEFGLMYALLIGIISFGYLSWK